MYNIKKTSYIVLIVFLAQILFSGISFAGWVDEPDTWSSNVPEKWFVNAKDGTADLDTTQKRSGSRSVKLTGTANVGQYVVLLKPWEYINGQRNYTITAYYMASDGYNGIPRISVTFLDEYSIPQGSPNTVTVDGLAGDRGWTQLSLQVTTPYNGDNRTVVSRLLVRFETEGTAGTVWFDDANVYYNSESGINKALNPGFETIYSQMSDAEFFSKLNLDYTGLGDVKTAVNAGNYALARSEFLEYYQSSPIDYYDSVTGGRNSSRPTPNANYQKFNADLDVEHYQNNSSYDKDYFMGKDMDWSSYPPNNSQQWLVWFGRFTDEYGDTAFNNVKLSMTMDGQSSTATSDISQYGNNGSVQGTGGEWSACKTETNTGGALKIGNSTYVSVADSATLDITSALTIEGWFRYDGTIAASYAVHKNSAYSMNFADSNGKPAASVYVNGAWRTVASPDSVSAGKWYHLAMTYSSTTHDLKLYVNSVLKAKTTLSGLGSYTINASASALAVGRDSSSASSYFNGFMDGLRISNTARSTFVPSEPLITDANTVSLFQFDEVSGTSVDDSSSSNNDGAIQGAGYKWSTAKYQDSFRTNGTGYIRVNDAASLDITDNISLEAYCRTIGTPGQQDNYVLCKDSAYYIKLQVSGGSIFPAGGVYVNGAWRTVTSNTAIDPNKWYNIELMYSSETRALGIYIDGVRTNSTVLSGLGSYNINASSSDLVIGGSSSGTSILNGFIDTVRITNAANESFSSLYEPWLIMGQLDEAYWYTGNGTYADELLQIMVDWIKDQQLREGEFEGDAYWDSNEAIYETIMVNWNPLNAGIWLKYCNWYLHSLRDSNYLTAERFICIMKSLYEHIDYIYGRMPDGDNGAVLASVYCYDFANTHPYFNEAPTWKNFFADEVYSLMKGMVYPDGADDELSPNYHNLCMANFKMFADMAEYYGDNLSEEFNEHLERMYEYTMYSIKPNGKDPQFSDSWSVNRRNDLIAGYEVFGRADMRYVGTSGAYGTEPSYTSYGFPYAGQYFMRSGWDSDDNYLGIDTGPLGSSHWHQDKLNFELSAYGRDFIVDPGVYTYNTGDWRYHFTGTSSHNTITVDNNGQVRDYDANAAALNAEPLNDAEFISSKYFDYVKGIYEDGYGTNLQNADKSVSHQREIFYVKPGYWIMHDLAKVTSGSHTITDAFQFNPMTISIDGNDVATTNNASGANMKIIPIDPGSVSADQASGQTSPIRGWVSYTMNNKDAAPNLRYTKTSVTSSTNFDFLLFPYSTSAPSITNTRLTVSQNGSSLSDSKVSAMKIAVSGSGENHYIMFSDIGTGDKSFGSGTEGIISDARVTFANRNSSNNSLISFTMIDGKKISDNGTEKACVYTEKNNNNLTIKYSGSTIEILTDLDINNEDAMKIYGTGISSVTVNGQSVSFKTDGSYIVVGKAPYLPDTNTKLLLHFDERSGSIASDSSSRSDISSQNGMLWTAGKYGTAFRNVGTNYVQVSDSSDLDIADNLTLEGWFKWDGNTGDPEYNHYLVQKGDAYAICLNSSHVITGLVYVDGTWRELGSGVSMTANAWTHIALTYSSTTHVMKVYVNGVEKASTTLSSLGSYIINNSAYSFCIGKDAWGSSHYFYGDCDDVSVSNSLKMTFPQTYPLLADSNTKLLLDFNEGQGNIIADSSGKNGAAAQGGSKRTGDVFNRAAEFSTSNNYINVPDSNSLDIENELTVEGWFKWDGNTGDPEYNHYMIQKGDAYGICLNASHVITGLVYVNGNWREVGSGVSMIANEWMHIAMTYSAFTKKIKIYVNGELKGTTTLSGLSTYKLNKSSDPLCVGKDAWGASHYFYGCVDEVRVSDTIRYNSMKTTPYTNDSDTVVLFHFDESSGTTVTDSSSNGNNGTFQAGTLRQDGKFNGAVYTDNSMYFSVADSAALDITDNLTLEGWFKWDGNTGDPEYNHYMVHKGDAYGICLDSSHVITGLVYVDGTWRELSSSVSLTANAWTHIAMTYSSTTHVMKVYVNGVEQASTTLSGLGSYTINNSASSLCIGKDAWGSFHYFYGSSDEVCISNTVKTSF